MKIVIGTDHRGYEHKEYIKSELSRYEWIDVGAFNDERTDYPLFAHKAFEVMQQGVAHCGILLCGSGGGMAIAVNRHPGMYAVVVWNSISAQRAKSDDNCNVLVLPADFISGQESVECIEMWLATTFKNDRYQERLLMIDKKNRSM